MPSHLLCDLEYADLSEPQLPPRKWIGCSLPGPLRRFSELMQEWGLEQYSHWSSINPLGGDAVTLRSCVCSLFSFCVRVVTAPWASPLHPHPPAGVRPGRAAEGLRCAGVRDG